MLRSLFDFYSMRAGRISCDSLKSGEFHRLMSDAGLTHPEAGETQAELKKRLDLVFCSVTTSCLMNYDQFLQAILKIAQFKFPQLEQQASVQSLFM